MRFMFSKSHPRRNVSVAVLTDGYNIYLERSEGDHREVLQQERLPDVWGPNALRDRQAVYHRYVQEARGLLAQETEE